MKHMSEILATPIPKIKIEVSGQQAIDIIRALAHSASENLERDKHHSTRCMIIAQKVAEEIQKKEMERITGRAVEKEMDRYF